MNFKMKLKFVSVCFLTLTFFCLTSCDSFTGVGTDNLPKPSPLKNIHSQFMPQKVWSAQIPDLTHLTRVGFVPGFNFAANTIFIANHHGMVTAINSQQGKVIWKSNLNTTLKPMVGAGNNMILVASEQGGLFALNQINGKIIWHSKLNSQIGAVPVFSEDKIFVKTLDGQLWAFNQQNGKVIWSVNHGAPIMVLSGGSRPIVANNKVIVGFSDGKLDAYAENSGKLLWETEAAQPTGASDVEQMIDIIADPVVSGNGIYIVTYQGNLSALNIITGQIIWQQPLSSNTGLALSYSNIFVIDAHSQVLAFNRINGQMIFNNPNLKYRQLTTPLLLNNYIVAGDKEGYLHWLDPISGEAVARIKISNDPIVKIISNNQSNNLYAFDSNGVVLKLKA